MSEDEQPKFGDYSFDDSTESGFEEKADQADNHESSENASSYSDDSEEDASAENRIITFIFSESVLRCFLKRDTAAP